MQWFETVVDYLKDFSIYRTTMGISDLFEILIIAFLFTFLPHK